MHRPELGKNVEEAKVYRPSWEEFKDFNSFIEKIESEGASTAGVCKVIPPERWIPRKAGYDVSHMDIVIEKPLLQKVIALGEKGTFRAKTIERNRMTLNEFYELSNQPINTSPHCESYFEVENKFWNTVACSNPIFGHNTPASLSDLDLDVWNMSKLGCILDIAKTTMSSKDIQAFSPSVSFGMWRVSYSWHIEDMDLYVINMLHHGSPKTWYVVPPKYGYLLERAAQLIFPSEARRCSNFMRHKTCLISPQALDKFGVPFQKIVQKEGEIIIAFPYAYHQGLDHGFNISEYANFATPSWIEFGKRSKPCDCAIHTAQFSIDIFVKNYQPEKYDDWISKRDIAPHPMAPPNVAKSMGFQLANFRPSAELSVNTSAEKDCPNLNVAMDNRCHYLPLLGMEHGKLIKVDDVTSNSSTTEICSSLKRVKREKNYDEVVPEQSSKRLKRSGNSDCSSNSQPCEKEEHLKRNEAKKVVSNLKSRFQNTDNECLFSRKDLESKSPDLDWLVLATLDILESLRIVSRKPSTTKSDFQYLWNGIQAHDIQEVFLELVNCTDENGNGENTFVLKEVLRQMFQYEKGILVDLKLPSLKKDIEKKIPLVVGILEAIGFAQHVPENPWKAVWISDNLQLQHDICQSPRRTRCPTAFPFSNFCEADDASTVTRSSTAKGSQLRIINLNMVVDKTKEIFSYLSSRFPKFDESNLFSLEDLAKHCPQYQRLVMPIIDMLEDLKVVSQGHPSSDSKSFYLWRGVETKSLTVTFLDLVIHQDKKETNKSKLILREVLRQLLTSEENGKVQLDLPNWYTQRRFKGHNKITVACGILKVLGFVKHIPGKPDVAVWIAENPFQTWTKQQEIQDLNGASLQVSPSTAFNPKENNSKYDGSFPYNLAKRRDLTDIDLNMVENKTNEIIAYLQSRFSNKNGECQFGLEDVAKHNPKNWKLLLPIFDMLEDLRIVNQKSPLDGKLFYAWNGVDMEGLKATFLELLILVEKRETNRNKAILRVVIKQLLTSRSGEKVRFVLPGMIEREKFLCNNKIMVASGILKALGFVKLFPNEPDVAIWISENPYVTWDGRHEFELSNCSADSPQGSLNLGKKNAKDTSARFNLSKRRPWKNIDSKIVVEKTKEIVSFLTAMFSKTIDEQHLFSLEDLANNCARNWRLVLPILDMMETTRIVSQEHSSHDGNIYYFWKGAEKNHLETSFLNLVIRPDNKEANRNKLVLRDVVKKLLTSEEGERVHFALPTMIERERVQYSKRITVATSFLKALGFVKQIPNKPHVAVWTSDNPLEKWRGKREYELFLKSSNDSTTPISLDDTSKYAPELFSLSKQRALKSINFQMVVDKTKEIVSYLTSRFSAERLFSLEDLSRNCPKNWRLVLPMLDMLEDLGVLSQVSILPDGNIQYSWKGIEPDRLEAAFSSLLNPEKMNTNRNKLVLRDAITQLLTTKRGDMVCLAESFWDERKQSFRDNKILVAGGILEALGFIKHIRDTPCTAVWISDSPFISSEMIEELQFLNHPKNGS